MRSRNLKVEDEAFVFKKKIFFFCVKIRDHNSEKNKKWIERKKRNHHHN